MGVMLLSEHSSLLCVKQSKRVDVDFSRRLGSLASQIEKSESYRMLSYVELSGMSHARALSLLDDYSHIAQNRRLELLAARHYGVEKNQPPSFLSYCMISSVGLPYHSYASFFSKYTRYLPGTNGNVTYPCASCCVNSIVPSLFISDKYFHTLESLLLS